MTSANTIIATRGVWIGTTAQPLAAWLTQTSDVPTASAVLILPPIGYEYWTTQQTLRAVAERLAVSGHAVLRVDYAGTGDSSGDQTDPERWTAWCSAVRTGVAALRAAGAESVTLVGLRLGGSIALLEAAAAGADAVVTAAPAVSGRRYARELMLLSTPVPESATSVEPGTICYAGTAFSPETVNAIAAVDLTKLNIAPAPRVLLLDRADGAVNDQLAGRLRALGCELEHETVTGAGVALDLPTEEAEVATDLVEQVAAWIGPAEAAGHAIEGLTQDTTTMPWRGGTVHEEFVRLGATGLAGVLSYGERVPAATIVFLNSGSEAHVGPGRAWVELARTLALAGLRVLRVDFRGWGESPSGGFAPGRPYDQHTLEDVAELVETLRRPGQPPLYLAGVCAGAWVGLKQAIASPVDGVIAMNPQMYWQPGDVVEAAMSTTRKRRMSEIEYFKTHGAELEAAGPHPAGEWLQALRDIPIPTLVISSVGDDGVEFLESRLPRAWAQALADGVIRLVTIDIDHALHQYWQRDELVGPILEFVTTSADGRLCGSFGRVKALYRHV